MCCSACLLRCAGAQFFASAAHAQTAAVHPERARLEGTWERVGCSINFDPTIACEQPDNPPLTPKYAQEFQAVMASAANGKPIHDPHADCIPQGMPRVMNMSYPFEVVFTHKKILIIPEEQSPIRNIWIDGRGHGDPADLDPTYMGHSTGHWEGNVLVVDTIGLRGDTYLTQKGVPHSDALHVIEHFRLKDRNTLTDEMTLIDPAVYTHPWTVTKTYKRTDYEIKEWVCEENNRNPIGDDGVTGVKLSNQ